MATVALRVSINLFRRQRLSSHATKTLNKCKGAWSHAINMNINELPVQWKFASAGPAMLLVAARIDLQKVNIHV